MLLLSTYNLNNRGFTLIEVIIAMAILLGVLSLGLFSGMDALHSSYSRSERDTVVSLLQKARSRAMANIDGVSWGVCYSTTPQSYVLFAGTVCDASAATSEVTPTGEGVNVTWSAPIIFSQVRGSANETNIVLVQQNKTSNITVNYEGTIIW